jgi:hypothetical protein
MAGSTRLLPEFAGADLMFQWIGMVEYIPCYRAPVEHWGFLPATRLASRIILFEQNIKKRTGPALCVLCGLMSYISRRKSLLNPNKTGLIFFLSAWLVHSRIYFLRDFAGNHPITIGAP